MKLYAFTAPEIPKHEGFIKIGETNGSVETRIRQESHELNVNCKLVWEDTIYTASVDRNTGFDKLIHRELVNNGFQRQHFEDTGKPTEWLKCNVDDIKQAFETVKQKLYTERQQREEVGRQFYIEVRNWFYWTAKANPSDTWSVAEQEYTLRVIVRLILCYFLRDKDLVPKELFDSRWCEDNLTDTDVAQYYKAVLRNVFFHCLNTPQNAGASDTVRNYENLKLFRNAKVAKEQFQKIPFLNGGLFNEHIGDDFALEDRYFFFKKHTAHIYELDGDYEVEGLVRILNRYQFKLSLDDLITADGACTAEEYANTIDPEFIGRVFESLLACVDADSNVNRRKITGSFYTPQEIVDYMVNNAVDAALQHKDDVLSLKIIDPACGSGAFPCGVMNNIIQRLDPNKELSQSQRYNIKLEILQNVIYGIDILPMAVQISELRLFLSLISELKPDSNRKNNYGIEPLPNLETKFVCANTLIGLKRSAGKDDYGFGKKAIDDVILELRSIRRLHFLANTPKRKQELCEQDARQRRLLGTLLEDKAILGHETAEQIVQWNPYDQTKSSPFFDAEWMFGVEKFDIVIGNPPYVSAPMMTATNPVLRKEIIDSNRFTALYQKWDYYVPFVEIGLQFLVPNGLLAMIVPYPLTNQTYAKKLRHLIFNHYNLYELSDLSGTKIFESATVTNCIPFIFNSPPQGSCIISHIDERRRINRSFIQPLAKLLQDEKTEVWNLTQEQRDAARYSDMNVLGDFCFITNGMEMQASEKKEKGAFVKDDLISETRDAVHCREYVEAKDIERYRFKRIRYLEYDTERSPDKLRGPRFRELFDCSKLLINCLGNITAALDAGQHLLHNHSLNACVLWKDFNGIDNKSITSNIKRHSRFSRQVLERLSAQIDLRYLLGILNSRYASVLLSNIRGGDYHIYPEHLRNIPVPDISLPQQQPLIDLVNRRLQDEDVDNEIDAFVYKLYGLTDEEIAFVENCSTKE